MDNVGGWAADISKRYKDWQEGDEAISSEEEEQFEQLTELGFEFNIIPPSNKYRRWEENFDAFCEFQQVKGHCYVPGLYKADTRLGRWVQDQRAEYKKLSEGKESRQLTQERLERLESAGFLWDGRKRSRASSEWVDQVVCQRLSNTVLEGVLS